MLNTSVRLIDSESGEHLGVEFVEHIDIDCLKTKPIACGPQFNLSSFLLIYDTCQRRQHAADPCLVVSGDDHDICLCLTQMRQDGCRG